MKWFVVAGLIALGMGCSGLSRAHAFPENSSPHVGASVQASPKQVKIWFNADLEPLFNTLQVKDAQGQVVSTGEAHVDAQHPALLEVSLRPALVSGNYHVYWHVTARDGHHTEGDFAFTVRPVK